MKATLAIITIGVVPVSEVLPLLTEHVSEQQITHLSLLGKMSREEVMEDYAVEAGVSRHNIASTPFTRDPCNVFILTPISARCFAGF